MTRHNRHCYWIKTNGDMSLSKGDSSIWIKGEELRKIQALERSFKAGSSK